MSEVPVVGVAKTAQEFMLTKPNSRKSAVVEIEENLLDRLLQDEFSEPSQEILGALYDDARAHETWGVRLWNVFRTENAFWHIQVVLTTAMFAISWYFLVAQLAGVESFGSNVPPRILDVLIAFGIAASSYSFYALFTKRRPRKRRAAMGLFLVYLYQLIYLNLAGQGTTLINITFLSLASVAVALFTEWSRPSK
jgi:hypothetical protein